jgi:putative redox protein
MNDIEVTFPGGKRVDARLGPFILCTDQPPELGGDGSAPSPFDLFLTSLATCAGLYVLGFCRARDIPTDDITLHQRVEVDEITHLPKCISLTLDLPASFPEKYRAAVVRAAEGCKVRKTIAAAPKFEIVVDLAAPPSHASGSEASVT